MIPGTGPGRGVPWWRQVTVLLTRHDDGFGREHAVRTHGEHGRVIKTVGKK